MIDETQTIEEIEQPSPVIGDQPSTESPAPVESVAPAAPAVPAPFAPERRDFRRGGPQRGGQRGGGRGGRGGGRGPRRPGSDVPAEADYEEKNIEVARVTRVTKGGKRMRFRVLAVIGNRKGRVGFGLAKGVDVAAATGKATTQARKALLSVPLAYDTIPHPVSAKFGAASILLKPAPTGAGIKAGGAVRIVLELAGIPNVVSKILGSSNKINNVKATFAALKLLRATEKKENIEPESKN